MKNNNKLLNKANFVLHHTALVQVVVLSVLVEWKSN